VTPDSTSRDALVALANIGEKLAMTLEGMWSLREALRRACMPEMHDVTELLHLTLEASDEAYSVEFSTSSTEAREAIRRAIGASA
jgi:hypothetical protein